MDEIVKVAQEAKDLLLSVPANEFITGSYTDDVGKCCSIGHLERLKSNDAKNYDVWLGDTSKSFGGLVRAASKKFIKEKHNLAYEDIASVNNNENINGYNEPEIKDRVIHLLNDMIEAGY